MSTFDPRPFIARAPWKLSKATTEKPDWEHAYIVEAKHTDTDEFRRFADLIVSDGYDARFEKIAYRYLRVDDHLYWLSRSIYQPGQNINRRPASDVEGRPEHEQATLPGLTLEAR